MKRTDGPVPKPRKRVQHFNEPGHAHFLTFSCFGRMALLSKDRARLWLAEAIDAARAKHEFDLWAWVFMPEHVHLLIWPRQAEYQTKKILADIKRPVGQQAIRWLAEHSPVFLERLTVRNRNRTYRRFWQAGPGQDHNVYDVAAAHAIIEYIHNNPVERGLVAHAEDWSWSSAAEWAGKSDAILRIDRSLPTLVKYVE
jgi:putative transposase